MKVLAAKSKWFKDSDLRLDAEFHLSEGPITQRLLNRAPVETLSLGKATTSIFSGKIFRRTYVKDSQFGYPYITASDMIKTNIESGYYLSKKHTSQKMTCFLRKGGYCFHVPELWETLFSLPKISKEL